jgi:hypothetical protein
MLESHAQRLDDLASVAARRHHPRWRELLATAYELREIARRLGDWK